MKRCSRCNVEKSTLAFNKDASMRDGLRCDCRECGKKYWSEYRRLNQNKLNSNARAKRAENPVKSRASVRKSHFKTKYGLSLEQLDLIRQQQGNSCAVCKGVFIHSSGKLGPQVDHCHSKGNVRGLLCTPCNRALGLLQDSSLRCFLAASYLQKFGS